MTYHRPCGNTTELIEQAIARGESLDRICTTLGVHPRLVDQVSHRMDLAAAESPREAS